MSLPDWILELERLESDTSWTKDSSSSLDRVIKLSAGVPKLIEALKVAVETLEEISLQPQYGDEYEYVSTREALEHIRKLGGAS